MFFPLVLLATAATLHSSSASSVHSGFYGLGQCPSVKRMHEFNITRIYGGKWYLIAHYSEEYFLSRDLRCMMMEFTDGNLGEDVCRVHVSNNSTVFDSGKILRAHYERLIPDEKQSAVWINTFLDSPIPTIILDSDYDSYIAWHECIHFPRDNPIVHEQHNYIFSRTALWEDPQRAFRKVLDVYESNDVDLGPFVWNDQQDCHKRSQ